MRFAIVWMGMEDPCKPRKDIEGTAPLMLAIKALFTAWFSVFDNTPVKVKSVINSQSEQLKESLLPFIFI